MLHYLKIYLVYFSITLLTSPSISYAWWGEDTAWSTWANDNGGLQTNIRVSPHGRDYDHSEQPTSFPFAYRYTPYESPCYGNPYEDATRYDDPDMRYEEKSHTMPQPTEFKHFDQNHYWATPYDMPFPPTSFSAQPVESRLHTREESTNSDTQLIDYKKSVWQYPTVKKATAAKTVESYGRSVWEYPSTSSPKEQKTSSWDYPSGPAVEKERGRDVSDAPQMQYRQYPTPQDNVPITHDTSSPATLPTVEERDWHYPDETITPPSSELPKNNSFQPKETVPSTHNMNRPTTDQMPRWQYVDDQGLPPLKPENRIVESQPYHHDEVAPQYPTNITPKTADFSLPPLK